ncbi:hypothetical protein HKX48_001687 [Thoreauomyces humboldtii]|nr:hypothetical protein HKX48_001687 [Thoreauomyces humboldtii]
MSANVKTTAPPRALCVGASSGIGAACAVHFATLRTSIIVVGRNEVELKKVVETAKTKASGNPVQGQTFDYIVADLSSVDGIKKAVKEVEKKAGKAGVQYVIQCQGSAPSGLYVPNADGVDKHFIVQCLSRFAIPYLLAKSGTLADGGAVVSVCASGGTGIDNVADMEMGKANKEGKYGKGLTSIPVAGNRDSTVVDSFTLDFKKHFPTMTAAHTFPGIVTGTGAGRNLPYGLGHATSLLTPFTWVGLLDTAASYATVPYGYATRGDNGLFTRRNTVVTPTKWVADESNRKQVWDGLVAMLK